MSGDTNGDFKRKLLGKTEEKVRGYRSVALNHYCGNGYAFCVMISRKLGLELIVMVAQWFPNEEIIVSGDSAYGGQSILSHLPPNVHLISHVHPNGALYEPAPPKKEKCKGPARKKGDRLPGMKQWADDPNRPWTKLKFNQFGLHATLEVKTIQALYYKAVGPIRDLESVLSMKTETLGAGEGGAGR